MTTVTSPPRRLLPPGLILLGAVTLLGCGRSAAPAPAAPAPLTPEGVLQRLIETYQKAKAYRDRGVVRLQYRQAGQWVRDEGKLEVQWQRPNRLRLRAYQLTLASDGETLQAIVADRDTRDLDRQVLHRPVPAPLTLESVYEDAVLREVVASGLGGPPVQLELLLAPAPLAYVLDDKADRALLADEMCDGRPCHRVRVTLAEGTLVWWIDRQDHVLRRLEYPAQKLAEQMAQASACSEVSLVADFRDAVLDGPLDPREFQLAVPPDARLVRQFVLPPQPPPSELLGQAPGAFHFTALDGQRVTRDAWSGRVAVLVWFNNHPASQALLEQVARVQAAFRAEPRLVFQAVCTEPRAVGQDQLRALIDRWGVRLPVVRDGEAFGRDVFRIPWTPTVVVLDPRGTVQLFEVGANPDLEQNLPPVLRQLLDGANVADKVRAQIEQERQAYGQALAAATVTSPPASPPVADPAAAARKPPGQPGPGN